MIVCHKLHTDLWKDKLSEDQWRFYFLSKCISPHRALSKRIMIYWKPYSWGSLLCVIAIPHCWCRLLLKSAYPARHLVNPEYPNDFPSLAAEPHCEVIHVSMWPNVRRGGVRRKGGKERNYRGWKTTGPVNEVRSDWGACEWLSTHEEPTYSRL